jgi:glutaredoxin-related protein
MERKILHAASVHPEAQKFISQNHIDTVDEVIAAISKHKVVVVGMAQNPVVKKARNILEAKGMEYTYLSYGSYVSKWKQRLAIKLWSGWPTFPQVFIDGKLIGGAKDLSRFLAKS